MLAPNHQQSGKKDLSSQRGVALPPFLERGQPGPPPKRPAPFNWRLGSRPRPSGRNANTKQREGTHEPDKYEALTPTRDGSRSTVSPRPMPSSKPPGTEHSSTASQPSVPPDRSRSPEPEPPSLAVASDNKLAVTDATSAKLGSPRCEVRVPAPSQAESFRVFALPTRTGFCFPLPGDTTEVGAEKGISRGQNTSSKTALSSSPGALSSPWKEMCPRPRRAQVARLASGDFVGW